VALRGDVGRHNVQGVTEQRFSFQPRWKEELVVTGSGGSFVLELPIGVLAAYLPTEAEWSRRAPEWARTLWPELKQELEVWCAKNNAQFHIDPSADVHPIQPTT
jgi:hypothetical protein